MRLWAGPAGGLIPLPDVEIKANPDVGDERIGGAHVGLTGARTYDVLGFKRSWSLEWEYLTPRETAVLRAMQLGTLGDLWLVEDSIEGNLMPLQTLPLLPGGTFPPVATFTPSGLNRYMTYPTGGGTWTSPPVPAVLDGAGSVLPVVGQVAGRGQTNAFTLTLNALSKTGALFIAGNPVSFTSTSSTGNPVYVDVSDLPSAPTQNVAFWQLVVTAGSNTGLRLGDVALNLGAVNATPAYAMPGGSARVVVDTASVNRPLPTDNGGKMTIRQV